jgi:hypothetical protein
MDGVIIYEAMEDLSDLKFIKATIQNKLKWRTDIIQIKQLLDL